MRYLKEINGYVKHTLDKLAVIKADLVRNDDDWQEWNFARFIKAFHKWTDRIPINLLSKEDD